MAYTEFYCDASSGSNMNGGSDAGAPAFSSNNGSWNQGTGVFTPTSGDPSLSVGVGDFASVFNDGATSPVFCGRVTAVSSTTITVSVAAGSACGSAPTTSATGRSIIVGGAWKGPNVADPFPFNRAGWNGCRNAADDPTRINLKSGTNYAITAGISMTATNNDGITIQGYTTTPGDGGRATIDGGTSGASFVLFTCTAKLLIADLIFQNNGATGSASGITVGINSQGAVLVERCKVANVRGNGIHGNTGQLQLHDCEVTGANQSNSVNLAGIATNSSYTMVINRCTISSNTGSNTDGVRVATSYSVVIIDSTIANNGKDGVYQVGGGQLFMKGCRVHGNTGDGVELAATGANLTHWYENCLFTNNGGYGVTSPTARPNIRFRNCGFYSNASGEVHANIYNRVGSVTLTGSPYNDAANGDFGLNSTAGAGAACRGAGIGTFTDTIYSGTTTSYPNIGGVQHQDAGGGVITPGGMSGGMQRS